ncbi:MAG: carboxypeptidase regulatory-like domain-containing protein [Anaerolineae bacterium]|nr:carboxypeptidase regulatory-like domain-containing protein [Anaerolineae bacterium]
MYAIPGSRVRLSHCDVGYAGSVYNSGLWIASSDVVVRHCRIHDTGTTAVTVEGNAQPDLAYNRFTSVTTGLDNRTPATLVDARGNWWGHAGGPYHATLNPAGQGVGASNGVLFHPWLGTYNWLGPDAPLAHGTTTLAWAAFGDDASTMTADLLAVGAGQSHTLGAALPAEGSLAWDTHSFPDGVYELRALFRAGTTIAGEAARSVTLNNSGAIAWHSGWIRAPETWAADRVHVVEGEVRVASGVTLTIDAGAVVKFAPDTGIVVGNGALLGALGSAGSPTVLTSLSDDSAGGDTNLDGSRTRPMPGDWDGIAIQGTGAYSPTAFVEVRYATTSHAGALAGSTTWDGTYVHLLTGDVTVPSGATLTIEPGAIVKLGLGRALIVNAGGMLVAQGTLAQPVIFTSIRDDAAGGDSNQDGNGTMPQPGDWYRIQVNGGVATLSHVQVRYGAGADAVNGALLRTDGSATLTVANSAFDAALYTGILAWGGGVTVTNTLVRDTDRGISAHPGSTVHVINSTVDGNRIGLLLHGGTLHAANTLVTHNSENGILRDYGPDALTIRYSDVWNPDASGGNYAGTADLTGQNGNLSVDPSYRDREGGDYRLGYLSPAIDAADGGLAPESDAMGAPRYDDPRTPNTGLPTPGGAYVDIGAYEFVETAESDIDLVVSEVQGPPSAVAGDIATVRWTVTNLRPGIAIGPWHDRIALSNGQTTIPAGETLVGEGTTLAGGERRTFSAAVRVPGGTVGNYYWQVTTNVRGEVFEGQNTANNASASAMRVALDLPELVIDGDALLGQFGAVGEVHWFKFAPAANQDVMVSLDGAGGALELYLGCEGMPTLQQYDARSTEWNSPTPTAVAENTLPGMHYVLAYARSLPGPTDFVIRAEALAFGLTSVSPTRVGNAGPVTLQLRGGQLGTDLTYALIAEGGAVYPATALHWENSTSVYATFDLSGAAPGLYDVQVAAPGGGGVSLPDAVEVTVGSGPLFVVEVAVPDAVRVGRIFYGSIRYENRGDADMIAPLMALSSGGQAELRLEDSDEFETEDLGLIAVAAQGHPGVLPPGQGGEIIFSAQANQTGNVHFDLTYHTADSSTPVDWAAFEANVFLDDLPLEEWAAVWAEFKSQCGDAWGGYVTNMARAAAVVRQRDGNAADLAAVYHAAIREIHHQLYTNVSGALYLSDTSHPLGGVGLLLSDESGTQGGYAQTAGDGAFYLEVAPGAYTVSVPGYSVVAPLTVHVPGTGSLTSLSVIAAAAGSLGGRIALHTSGEPLAEAPVQATSEAGQTYTAASDADGYYRIDGLPSDVYTVTAGGGDWGSILRPAQEVAVGLTQEGVDFALDPAITLAGQVTRADDGTPVAGARVLLEDRWRRPFSGETDAEGRYAVGQLAPGAYTLWAIADGYGLFGPEQWTMPAGITEMAHDLELDDGATIDVTVLDAVSAQPLEGASAQLVESASGALAAYQLSAPDGHAMLADLPAGTYVLSVDMEGRWAVTETLSLSPGESLARTVALHEAGMVSGQVTGLGGAPLADVPLQALSENGALLLAYSDGAGHYAFAGLPAGQTAISLWGGQALQEVEISAASWQQTVDLALSGVSMTGRVVAEGGAPVDHAAVLLLQEARFVASAPTNTDGQYRFVALRPGSYTLVAGAAAGVSADYPVSVGGDDLALPDIVLGTLSVTGDVQDAAGLPLGGASVTLAPVEEGKGSLLPYLSALSVADTGGFELHGLPAGAYVLHVRLAGYGFYRQEMTLDAPGPLVVGVVLGEGRSISGRVRSAYTGQLLDGAWVAAYDAATTEFVGGAATGTLGSYRIGDLPDGTYDLVVTYASYRQAEALGCIVEGDAPRVDFSLHGQDTLLHGWVVDDAGSAVPGVLVSARNSRGETVAYATASYDGAYRFAELLPGTYALQASAYGFGPAQASGVVLADGQTVEQDLVMAPKAMSTQSWLASVMRAAQEGDVAAQGNLGSWFYALIDYLSQHNPKPTRIAGDGEHEPQIPDAKCFEAYDELGQAHAAKTHKDQTFKNWQDAHKMYNTNIWTSGGVFALQYAQVVADLASLALPETAVASFVAQYGKASYALTQLGPIATSLYLTIRDFPWDFSSGEATLSSLSAFFGTVNNVASGGVTIWNLFKEMKQIDWPGFGVIGAFLDTLSLLQETYNSYQVFVKAADSVPTAQDNYFAAYAEMMRRIRALNAANEACCEPEFECCPPEECCTDECCVGSDCGNDPPPPPPGGGGASGGTNVVGARDPNEKLTIGYGPQGWVAPDADLIYTIYFENVPTATVAAQLVLISDTLDANLDRSSVELLGMGFNQVEVSVPPGLNQFEVWSAVATDPYPVRVHANLDVDTGALTWLLESIDPVTGSTPDDPWAGFLPPNDEQGSGEGHVTFRVKPTPGLTTHATIENWARIVFDVNEPIDTNQTLNTIDADPPTSSVEPLPPSSPTAFTVRWSGADVGAGVAHYDVYVSTDGGAYGRWQSSTTATQALFAGAPGRTYRFYSVATDWVGHRQPTPDDAQASTTTGDAFPVYLPLIRR